MKIEIINNESGDWSVLLVDGREFASGHSISKWDWIDMIKSVFGVKVESKEISDEDMENEVY